MTELALAGLSYVVRRGHLRHRTRDGVRLFATTCFDDELLAVVDAAAAADVPLALVVPLPAADIPIVLGAASIVAEIARTRTRDVTVTVVSERLSQRASYDQMYIGRDRLADVIPRARLAMDGRLETVGAARGASRGRLVLTSDPVRATRGGAFVVDGTGADPGDLGPLLRRGRRLVYVTDNPFDAALEVIRAAGGAVWAFDPAALGQLAATSYIIGSDGSRWDGCGALAASPELLRAAGSAQRTVWAPEVDSDLDAALRSAWTSLGHLASVANVSGSLAAAHALRWAWGTLATFTMSVTTPQSYDRHVPRGPYGPKLADAAEHAHAVARNMTGAARDAWAAVGDAFADVKATATSAPKLPLVRAWLDSLVPGAGPGLLVTRNRTAVEALTQALNESPDVSYGWSDLAHVVGVRDVVCGRVADLPVSSMLVTGPVPRAYASLIAAPPAQQVVTLAAGTWEAGRAARQTVGTLRELAALRDATVTGTSARLHVRTVGSAATAASSGESEVTVRRNGAVTAATDLAGEPSGSPWEPFDVDLLSVIARARPGTDDAAVVPPPARSGATGSAALVAALMLVFTDGQCLLVEPNDVLYVRRGDDARRVAAKAVAPGDVVVLVDATSRRDLFDTVVDVLSELPKYRPLSTLISFWHERARAARDRGYTLREILASMRSGNDPTRITTEQAIGSWIRGDSEGPVDPDDVRRFAIAVRDRDLADRAPAVAQALRVNRVLHRAVGRWLSTQIRGAQLDRRDAVIDPELGVYVTDLLEAVSVHEVAAVGSRLVSAPAGAVGMLLDPATAHHIAPDAALTP